MRRALGRALPAVAGAALLAPLLGHLLDPRRVLAARDVPHFHLPLLTTWAALAAAGPPLWNPLVQGGQPVLSNPNYASFYPPTWLALALAPATAIHLLVIAHAAWAFAGAWWLARRLGCGAQAALVAAAGFAAGGATLSTLNLLTAFFGLAWLPWALLAADRYVSAPRPAPLGWLVAAAAALALQLFAGQPAIVLVTALAIAALGAAATSPEPGRRAGRLVATGALTGAFAAPQLLPTLARLAGTARAGGLDADQALAWSTRPARLVELVLPGLWGDVGRFEEGLYFGLQASDQGYPYIAALHPGVPVLVIATAALVRWPVPRRWAWLAMVGAGILLALGRHNPLYRLAAETLPALRSIRFPERFLLLATSALPFAAGLGWQHLLDERRRGRRAGGDFPLALALVLAGLAAFLVAVAAARPRLLDWFVRASSLVPPGETTLAAATALLERELWLALGTGAATAAALALYRFGRVRPAVAGALLVAVLGGELWWRGRSLAPTVERRELLARPAVLAGLEPAGGRLFVVPAAPAEQILSLRDRRAGPGWLWSARDRLEPHFANLWGFAYALNPDADRMATGPARRALALLAASGERPAARDHLLGAWGVRHVITPRPLAERLAARLGGAPEGAARRRENPLALPIWRWLGQVEIHADAGAALAALAAQGFDLGARDHWLGDAPGSLAGGLPSSARWSRRGAHRHRLAYSSREPLLLVGAHTFDRGWTARLDGEPLPVFETAAGQIGLALPPGERSLELVYRERWLVPAAALSWAALGAVAIAAFRRRRAAAASGAA